MNDGLAGLISDDARVNTLLDQLLAAERRAGVAIQALMEIGYPQDDYDPAACARRAIHHITMIDELFPPTETRA